MIIVLKPGHTIEDRNLIEATIIRHGYKPVPIEGELRTVIAAVGGGDNADKEVLFQCETMPGVERVMRVMAPYKLVARVEGREKMPVRIGAPDDPESFEIGGEAVIVMAGPCSVESEDSLLRIAHAVRSAGARILRGGAFKPRTSPYSFQGMGEQGLKILRKAAQETGLKIATEVMAVDMVELVAEHADILQIGARNMQNYPLLLAVGRARKPVLLKRGISATIEEFLMAAEYICSEGNPNVILCERGIRTFETATRFTLDINAVPLLARLTHLPVVVDPSHASGHWDLVGPLSRAALAAGADGLIIEVHDKPHEAMSDGSQSLLPSRFARLMEDLEKIAGAVGRRIG